MSLSPWEQDALDSIKDGLTDSDPGLVESRASCSHALMLIAGPLHCVAVA